MKHGCLREKTKLTGIIGVWPFLYLKAEIKRLGGVLA